MPSPSRLNASVVASSRTPGTASSHQADWNASPPSPSIDPQLGIGGRTPTPRNDSVASNTIEAGTSSEVSTVTCADRFGRTSPNMILTSEAPRARAASMNSRRLSMIT